MNDKNNISVEIGREIRDFIQKLEDIKDDIIEYLNSLKKLYNPQEVYGAAHIKEFYLNVVSGWEMLRIISKAYKF